MQNAVVLITYKPNEIYLDFLNKFNNYQVYIMIDDNSISYDHLQLKYTNLKIIQIDNDSCYITGFINSSTITLRKNVISWDKALYFFSHIEQKYNHVWFLEDDIFFNSENTLLRIDAKYEKHDILCNSSFEEAKLNEWLWERIAINLPPPYYCGMMCVTRMSRKMLSCIKDYADKNFTIFFIEALFPTIAKYNNLLIVSNPTEFLTVTHRNIYNINEFNSNNLYHPVKNIQDHINARKLIK